MNTTHHWSIEVTDTFGGEANYSWVRRYTLETDEHVSDLALVRRAKRIAGWTGTPCHTENHGDLFVLRPRAGAPIVLFIALVETLQEATP